MNRFESFENISPRDTPSPEIHRTQETAHELLGALDSVRDFTSVEQKNLLTDLSVDHLIVRREDPERIIKLITENEPIELSFVGGTPYANSVEWNPRVDGVKGLDNAYLEGFSHKDNVVAVYGFEKPAEFYLKQLDDSQRVFSGVDRTRVRAAAGFVSLDDVQFVTVRIPISALPENELTEEERDLLFEYQTQESAIKKPAFAYRTYIKSPHNGGQTSQ